jgi:hypothetical protein
MRCSIGALVIGIGLGVVMSSWFVLPGHAAPAGRYAAFAGNYWLHDGHITIRPSGWGLFSYGYPYDCPHGVGSCRWPGFYTGTGGKPGPYATFQLTTVQGNAAYGYVLTDTQPAFLGLTVRVVRRTGLPSVSVTLPDMTWPGCRLPLPLNYQQQCGA